MTDLTITRHPSPTGGEYRAQIAGETATGLLTWRSPPRSEDKPPIWIVDATLVPTAIGGRGVAARLVEAIIADARQEGAKIVPSCSYVAVAFKRHPEWSDLLA